MCGGRDCDGDGDGGGGGGSGGGGGVGGGVSDGHGTHMSASAPSTLPLKEHNTLLSEASAFCSIFCLFNFSFSLCSFC